jgi:hypothetical protein
MRAEIADGIENPHNDTTYPENCKGWHKLKKFSKEDAPFITGPYELKAIDHLVRKIDGEEQQREAQGEILVLGNSGYKETGKEQEQHVQ